jgi:hypothetical protein
MADNTVRQLLHDLEKTIHERLQMVDEYIVRRMPDNVLLARIEKLEEEIKQLRQPMIPSNPLVGIEVITKDLKKDLILEAPDRINEADRLLLNSTARKALEEEEQEQDLDAVYEEQEEKDEELFLEKHEEQEQEQEAQLEEEDEPEADEQEEEEGQEVEEFEYKGATYYRDTEKNVYMLNEEGALTQIGVWSDVKARIIVKKPDA